MPNRIQGGPSRSLRLGRGESRRGGDAGGRGRPSRTWRCSVLSSLFPFSSLISPLVSPLNRLLIGLALAGAPIAGPSPAVAQVTTTEDQAVDPPPQSLRAEIAATAPGGTVSIEIPTEEGASIDLADGLVFGQSLSIDNANEAFAIVPIVAPDDGPFLEIQSGVRLTLRDVALDANPANPNGVIDLQTASSVLETVLLRADQTIDADLVGAGALVKSGGATLDLRGVNSFTGGLTIQEGDVLGDVLSLAGAGMGDIVLAPGAAGTAARIVFDIGISDVLAATGPAFIADETSGGEAFFVKRGEGELDVRAAAFDPGIAFDIEDGRLLVDDAIVAGPDFQVRSGGTLAIQGLVPDLSGRLEGAGSVEFTPSLGLGGVLTLSGDLSGFTGELGILQPPGSVALVGAVLAPATPPSGSLDFSVSLDPGTIFEISAESDLVLTGDISGAGTLFKLGGGTTRLTGVATHTGGTQVVGGILIGDTRNLQRSLIVADGAELRFDQVMDGTFLGSIVERDPGDAITVRKTGLGSLTLGASQGFAGTLAFDEGGLVFAAGVDLANASLVVGNGDSIPATLSTPFDPQGSALANTVEIGGDLILDDDARLVVSLADRDENGNPAARSTVFAASGQITIGGSSPTDAPELVVRLRPGSYADPALRRFTILTADGTGPGGGVVVQNDFEVSEDLFFFDLDPLGAASQAGTYQLDLLDSGAALADAAGTPNQRAIGSALDDLRAEGAGADPELATLLDNLATLTNDGVDQALDGLSGDSLIAAIDIRLAAAARAWRSLSNRVALAREQSIGHRDVRKRRLQRTRGPSPGPERLPASVDAGPPPEAAREPWVAWLEANGLIGELDSDEASGYDYRIVGPIFGADRALSEQVRVGFTASGTRSAYEADGASVEGSVTSFEAMAYGAWIGEPATLLVGARYGHSWIETDRRVRLEELESRIEGDFEGDELGLYAELTRAFGTPSRVEIAPFANVAYSRIELEGFDENGTSPVRLQVEASETDSALTSVGVRIALEREMDEGFVFRPRARVSWGREWADVERPLRGRFAAGTTPIALEAAELPRDRARISVGWEVGYARHASLYVGWDGRFAEDLIENALSLGLRAAW